MVNKYRVVVVVMVKNREVVFSAHCLNKEVVLMLWFELVPLEEGLSILG